MKATEKQLLEAKELMQEVIDDWGVPRNIRKAVKDALDQIDKEKPTAVDFSNAIYYLDDITNDINIPSHTRTTIWTIISRLEEVKEKIKNKG
jgi:hypothetical protein